MIDEDVRPPPTDTYNERLFARPGLRRFYHMARFNWVRDKIDRHVGAGLRLIELGCYDGRLFEVLGARVSQYVGLDANWGEGLTLAREKYRGRPGVTLLEANRPEDLEQFGAGEFNVAAALETLEHVPPEMVPGFLDEFQRVTRGYLFLTVPNELGAVFLAKWLAKRFVYRDGHHYSPKEVVAATLRRSDKVERDDHKGFDYRHVIAEVAKRFDIIDVDGLASLGLPAALSPTVGIFAKSRDAA